MTHKDTENSYISNTCDVGYLEIDTSCATKF